MEADEIKLQKIISSYCPWTYDHIDLALEIKGRYVSNMVKDKFGDDVCNQWNFSDAKCTELHNQLFVTIKRGVDIITFIHTP